jgi:hypothetical protein
MPKKWTEVKEISVMALDRIGLWDAIEKPLNESRNGLIFLHLMLLIVFIIID